jgi:transposase
VYDDVPRNYGDVITIIGALTVNGLSALFTYRGGTTKEAFLAYVREVLAEELEPDDAVVLDNLAEHKDPRVRDTIETAGAKLYFLPPYGPDLNLIELAWCWVKRWLKTARAKRRTRSTRPCPRPWRRSILPLCHTGSDTAATEIKSDDVGSDSSR